MRRSRSPRPRTAFALAELVALVVVGAVVVLLLVPATEDLRRRARLGSDEANLRRIGTLTGAYAADNADRFWTFSWKGGVTYNSPWPSLNHAPTDLQASVNQAIAILRRRTGRVELIPFTGWFPHVMYSHLVLEDYVPMQVPDRMFISSADRHRLLWASNPKGFDAGLYTPAPSTAGTISGKRWPYSASYHAVSTFFDLSGPGHRVLQGWGHTQHFVPATADLSGAPLASVAHPSQKVMLSDVNARHFGTRQPYCTHDEARLPLLFADGNVRVSSAIESNPGWRPHEPGGSGAFSYFYAPEPWEPPTMSGSAFEQVIGRFRWTRGTLTESGIVGRDFGGPEVGP